MQSSHYAQPCVTTHILVWQPIGRKDITTAEVPHIRGTFIEKTSPIKSGFEVQALSYSPCNILIQLWWMPFLSLSIKLAKIVWPTPEYIPLRTQPTQLTTCPSPLALQGGSFPFPPGRLLLFPSPEPLQRSAYLGWGAASTCSVDCLTSYPAGPGASSAYQSVRPCNVRNQPEDLSYH